MAEPIPSVLEYVPERPRVGSAAIAWYEVLAPLSVGTLAGCIAGSGWALSSTSVTVLALWYRRRGIKA